MTGEKPLSQKLFLNPGELVIAEEPVTVTTVLGSCIAVVLFSPRLRVGAICHAVLPTGNLNQPSKYADQSVSYMLAYFSRRKIASEELVAKMFGGADMFTLVDSTDKDRTVGAQNIRAALDGLRSAGLEPAALDIGGKQGRKLIFHSHTGEVFLKRLNRETMAPKSWHRTGISGV